MCLLSIIMWHTYAWSKKKLLLHISTLRLGERTSTLHKITIFKQAWYVYNRNFCKQNQFIKRPMVVLIFLLIWLVVWKVILQFLSKSLLCWVCCLLEMPWVGSHPSYLLALVSYILIIKSCTSHYITKNPFWNTKFTL